jgi:hypothetical protein
LVGVDFIFYRIKGLGSLEGLVRIWMIFVFLALPGLQMNSKAYYNLHANQSIFLVIHFSPQVCPN